MEVSQALISLDCTEAVVDEAIATGARLLYRITPLFLRALKGLMAKPM
jgi:putative NIF3 family GTP cyclohydrolase 1 type 2